MADPARRTRGGRVRSAGGRLHDALLKPSRFVDLADVTDTMPLPKDKAWFPAKTYGWGWGIPSRWQGWGVFLGFILAMIGGASLAKANLSLFIAYSFFVTGVLIAICWWKGERPSWRWGED